ncbi:tol-pal system protein YbgF [Vibrio rumoiensis]|uniref:Cell division coordinator CpoB n=1 Tax=Vibrio rumoiensis 1S-45 TaxID=1188252 RepID=A0A1E5E1F6_9VIBR|nr:tol-pal system protein YbgF [Vibrio rumoiensis]OEF24810.1 tol-pal system protein YbgF [Vibrio rumoiensis 1S-45]
MFGNLKRVVTLTLLVSAASPVLAAPAPVSDLNDSIPTASGQSETNAQRLQRLLDNSNRVQARLQQQVDNQEAELSSFRGTIERNNYEMKQMVERQRQLFVELDQLRTEVNNLKSAPTASASVSGASAAVSSEAVKATGSEQDAYQSAVDLILKDRNYDGAITAFKDFQAKYPNSGYSANAHYWLGQLYFAKKQDVDSAKSFAAVVSDKDSPKRADALVKLGDIAKRNNNAKAANKYYQQVITEYPNSSAAKLAQSNL